MRNIIPISVATAALACAAGSAQALDPVLISGGFESDTGAFPFYSVKELGRFDYHGGEVVTGDDPGAYASAVGIPGAQVSDAELYYAQINGPAGTSVPIRLNYRLSSSGGRESWGWVSLDAAFSQKIAGTGVRAGLYCDPSSNRDGVCGLGFLGETVSTGQVIAISVWAMTQDGGAAYADPFLEIDPTWAAANPSLARGLSFSFSPGVTNGYGAPAPGVPEPAAWAMMLLGLGLAGTVLRGRARSASVAGAL